MSELSPDERKQAREAFEGTLRDRYGNPVDVVCVHCAGIHDRVHNLHQVRQPCPRVRRVVWHGNEISEVEYWPDGRWDSSRIVFQEDAYEEDETEEETGG
jgi:hypothetical protein